MLAPIHSVATPTCYGKWCRLPWKSRATRRRAHARGEAQCAQAAVVCFPLCGRIHTLRIVQIPSPQHSFFQSIHTDTHLDDTVPPPQHQLGQRQTDPEARMNAAIGRAIAKGDLAQVTCLLQVHPLLATTRIYQGGWTPLLLAAYHDQPAVIKLLLTRGAPINEVDTGSFRRGCLHWVAHHGQALLALQLVQQHGAEVDLLDAEKHTPLHRACRADQPLTVLTLLLAGADPKARTEDGDLPADITDSRLARLFLLLAERRCGGGGAGARTQPGSPENRRLKPWHQGYQTQLHAGSPSTRSTESGGSWEEEEDEEEERGVVDDDKASLLHGGEKGAIRQGVFSIVV